MLKERTPEAAVQAAPSANGSNGSVPHELPMKRPPRGPSFRRGLPPGPRIPAPLQMMSFWYRRNVFYERCRERYGTPFTLYMRVPAVPFVVLSKPEHLKEMFLAPPDVLWAGDGSSELMKYFGAPCLAYFEEDRHLVRRRLINRSTHGGAMKHVAASVDGVVGREIDSWPRGEPIELFPRVRRMAVKVIMHVNFGHVGEGWEPDPRLDELVDVIDDMLATGDRWVSVFEEQYFSPRTLDLLTRVRPFGYGGLVERRARADELIYGVIADRRRAGATDGHDTVSVLLGATNEDGTPISDLEIRNECMTNFFAGTATTSAAMAWAGERIAREHAVRERLVSEIDGGEDDAYRTATVYEILRRKPPLPQVIPRLVKKPFELDGWRFPPGVRMLANAYLTHHDPANYEEPYAFRPERFLDDGPGIYTWIPFGGGRRRCLGKPIAEAEISCFLRELFGRYDVHPERREPEGTRSYMGIIRPWQGGRVTISERA